MPGTGAHVVTDADGTAVVRTAAGRFLRLQSPPPDLTRILTGESTRPAAPAAPDEEYVAALRAEMSSREAADARRRWPAARRTVTLVGSGRVLDDVAEALDEWDVHPRRRTTDSVLQEGAEPGTHAAHLVIAYGDSPAERADWPRLDTLPNAGIAWLRAYRDGENCFVDPLCVTPADPGSEQVRRRRLAAALVPGPLRTWQHATVETRPMSSGARMLTVGRILTVALAWAQDREATAGDTATVDVYRRTLWKFVPATGVVSEHPVLGYAPPHVPDEPVDRP
ncbi:hypothetical protein BJF85_15475 [Saccharomonospora sp. CUA-673]|nr:hypothetical protein BJF85_15475 [Saccharomonospora sp. CUA-673]